MKKVLSLALTLCMLVSMFSFSSFAGDDSSASVSATPQITATNSVGSIVKESLESATEEETTGDYVISKLSVEDGKIVCRVAALESSTLIVAFYDESTDQMLTSTNCTVTNTQRDYSLNLPNDLPEYYIVKAFLVGEKGEPRCDGYVYKEKTTEFAQFLKKTTQDFDDNLVVNFDEDESNNFLVLSEDAIIVDGKAEENKLEKYDVDKGEYTFSNVTATVKNLKKDDVFRYNGENNESQVIKVEKVELNGNIATVFAQNAGIEDVFEYAKIDTTANTDDFKEFGDGEEYTGTVNYDEFKSDNAGQAKRAPKKISGSGSKNILAKTFSLNKTLGAVKVTGQAALKIDANVKYYLFDGNNSITFTVTPTACAKFSASGSIDVFNLNLKGLSVTFYGIEISLVPTFKLSVSGKVDTTAEIACVLGFEWSEKNGFVNKSEKPTLSTKLDAEATVYAGLFISPVVTIGVGDFNLQDVVHASLTAEFSVQDKLTYSVSNDKQLKTHDCDICLDGSITDSIIVTGEVKLFKTWSKKLYSHNGEIGHHYISVSKGQMGLGYCPHRYYQVDIDVKNNGGPVNGIKVSLGGGLVDSNGDLILDASTASTNSKGVVTAYFKPGTYGLTFTGDGYQNEIRNITVEPSNKVKKLKVNLYRMTSDPVFNGEYKNGDIILFGNYPQTQVTDRELLAKFSIMDFKWSKLEYDKVRADEFLYCDFEYEGNMYRAAKDNYNLIKFYIYEPVEWVLIDEDYGLFITVKGLDKVCFNKTVKGEDGYYYKKEEPNISAGSYENSDYRTWLNGNFYNVTFSDIEKSKIKKPWIFSYTDGSIIQDTNTRNDNIQLLSEKEAYLMREYLDADSSEYSISQGNFGYDNINKAMCQWLRVERTLKYNDTSLWDNGDRVPVIWGWIYNFWGDDPITEFGASRPVDCYGSVRPAIRLNIAEPQQKTVKKSSSRVPFSLRGNIVTVENTVKDSNYLIYKFKEYTNELNFSSDNLLYIDELKSQGGNQDVTINPIAGSGKVVVCGDFGDGVEIAVNGVPHKHEFTEEIIKEPTCAQNGEKKLTCQCGKVEIVAIPALGHKEETIKGTPATCTKDGLTDGTKCSVCGEVVKAQEIIKATGNHAYSAWKVTKPATCTATGTQTRTCSVCGKTETQTIAKTAHKAVTDKAVAATCTKNGKTAGSHCSVCGTVLKAQTTVKAKGHNYGKWSVTKQPTYTATGIQTRTCTACGAKQTATVAKRATTSIAKCTVSTSKYAVYTGKALAPKVTVKNSKTTLKAGAHYTVAYKNNTKIGKATVTIKGIEKNGYSGSKTLTFNILPGVTKSLKTAQSTSAIKLAWSKVAGATGYRVFRHDGKKWVKLADTKSTTYTVSKLKAGTSYKYAVRAYTTVGKTPYWSASYPIITTATKPATPTLKAKAGTKQAALSWNKIAGATGYEVWMAAGKNGSYKKLTTVKKNSTVKYTAKKLKKGTTYYFKVRAYKTVDGKNVYGGYSKTIAVKSK